MHLLSALLLLAAAPTALASDFCLHPAYPGVTPYVSEPELRGKECESPMRAVSQDECLEAVKGLLEELGSEEYDTWAQGRPQLITGAWSWVPPGCSIVQGWNADLAAHYSTGSGWNDGHFTPVCNCRTSAPTEAPTTSAPTEAPTASALGDAHFFGPHGDRTDFKGRNNTYYNVLSTNNLSANVLFVHDTYNWRNKVVFGSWMKSVAVSAKTSQNNLVKAAYHCERPSVIEVHFEGEAEPVATWPLSDKETLKAGAAFEFQDIKVSLSYQHVFALSNGEWEVEAKNSYLPYKSQNLYKKRLDINLKTISDVDMNPVAPHGLIGQAWDRDDKMVIGALDDYNTAGGVVETTAMAEGAIEGSAVDYEIDPRNPFSAKFKYSRFGLKRAAPRDVSLLSGKKLASLEKTASGGAMNDAENEA